jgi:hypothetical protein
MYRILTLAILAVLISACEKKPEDKEPVPETVADQLAKKLDLDKAVIRKPAKLVSVNASVDLAFRSAVIPPHLAGTILDKSPFEFEPDISGSAKWISTSLIRFTPEKPLPPGTEFKAVFRGKVAFGRQRNVNVHSRKRQEHGAL